MFGLGTGEIILIVALGLLLFGGKKLPEVAKGVAKGIREFKRELFTVEEVVSNPKKIK